MRQMLSTTLRFPGVCMEQKSRFKFLPWQGFAPQTSHLAVQHTIARPPSINNFVHKYFLNLHWLLMVARLVNLVRWALVNYSCIIFCFLRCIV